MKNITDIVIGLAVASATLYSCEETVTLDLGAQTQAIVIDGWITNESEKSQIKISRTAGFYQTGATEKITDAIVMVTDSEGLEIPFHHNVDEDDTRNGFYYPPDDFKGKVGLTYNLSVIIGSEEYNAQDNLVAVTGIDSLGFHINDEAKEDPDRPGEFFEVLFYATEPTQTVDFYLFKYYRNDTIAYNNIGDVYYTNDESVAEYINGLASPVFYKTNDKATVEVYSLSRNAFLFYNDLSNLLNSDGGMFTPPAVNPRTNLTNGAMGFFRACAVSRAEVTLTDTN